MNEQELLLAVIGYIMATKKQPKSELEVQAIAQEVVSIKQSNPKQYQQLVQMGQQALQQQALQQPGAKVAALGAKLNYLNKLKGVCPEGTEKVYMAKGGCMCKPKAAEGAELKEKSKKMNEVLKFKAEKGIKVAKKDIDKKTYQNLPSNKKTEADEHYLGKATSDNKDGSYNISHKPNASDSTYIDRKHMSPNMQKKYPKKACGDKLVKKKK